jgi:hypothetical protein
VPAVLALLLGACGEVAPPSADAPAESPTTPPTPTKPTASPGLVRGIGTVLDDGDGPELCLGPIMSSLPPQCGGPRLAGWDWSTVESAHRAGVRWTVPEYVVTGTFDGTTFAVTGPPLRSEDYDGPRPARSYEQETRLATPCPEPEGGWRPVDPARTSHRTLQQVARAAEHLDGYAGLWWDQSVNPAHADPGAEPASMNDPQRLVVNVRVVGDTAAAETELRKVWGGALCVSAATRTAAELRRIQTEVARVPGLLAASAGHDVVDLDVAYDDGSLQRRFDADYGAGVVRVHSAIFPVTDGAG